MFLGLHSIDLYNILHIMKLIIGWLAGAAATAATAAIAAK